MIPGLLVRTLGPESSRQLRTLLNQALQTTDYSASLDESSIRAQIFQADPPTVQPLQWHGHRQLGAWRDQELLGFIDLGVALEPDWQPQSLVHRPLFGCIRFLALATADESARQVAAALLRSAELFWTEAGVTRVRAFAVGIGYPAFQAGAGLLPERWHPQIDALSSAGYRLLDRYYCQHRRLADPLEEVAPLTGLSTVLRGSGADRRYQLYVGANQVGRARVMRTHVDFPPTVSPVAYLAEWAVNPAWQGKGIGKWLLRRLINDVTLQGYQRLVLHTHPNQHAASYLCGLLGFEQLAQRGFVFEKRL